jgi:hypothetical protein
VKNTGTVPLNVLSVTSSNPDFHVVPSSASIPAGDSAWFAVTFSPSSPGLQNGEVVFFHNASGSPDTVTVSGTGIPLIHLIVPVPRGWNMISLPVCVEDSSVNTLFPTAIGQAFYYYEGGYPIHSECSTGKGYWLRFGATQNISIEGAQIVKLSIPLEDGWNMIGSLSVPIPVSSIIGDSPGLVTSRFFGYDNGYTHKDTLLPGKGYWVKSNGPGTLTLDATLSAEAIAKSRIRITPTDELPPPSPDRSTAVERAIPKEYGLDQAYPNPFNPTTTIRYQLSADSRVSLKVYNVLGEMVTALADETQAAGYCAVEWNAVAFASGIYFYRIEATSVSNPSKTFTQVKKMVLIK